MQQENKNYSKRMEFDKDLYDRDVLLKTAYAFTDQVYLHLEQNNNNWIVLWEPKTGKSITEKEFENEMIFQKVRKVILNETADVRKIVLARAMASTVIDTSAIHSHDQTERTEDEKEILRNWYNNDQI